MVPIRGAASPPPIGFEPVPFYCEENVWQLGSAAVVGDPVERYVVFVSNAQRQCALWAQRASDRPDGLVIWDYHVVLVARSDEGGFQVWDVDSRFGYPVALAHWLLGTFPHAVPPAFIPGFRVVPFGDYVRVFASDRSHMRRSDGTWQAPPPTWPMITGDDATSPTNLMRFVDVESDFLGERLSLEALLARFA